MDQWTKRWVVPILVIAMVLSPMGFSAFAAMGGTEGNPTGDHMVADLFLLRPVGIIATAFGAVCFVASLPFSAPTKSAKPAFNKLVSEPAAYTFARPLGQVTY